MQNLTSTGATQPDRPSPWLFAYFCSASAHNCLSLTLHANPMPVRAIDCVSTSVPTDQVAIDNLADLTNAAPSLCRAALDAYLDVDQAANWLLSLSAEQQANMLPSNPPLSDLDAIAIKWQWASYARHNGTTPTDHIRLHKQLCASGNEHLVHEFSSLMLNGPLEDHEDQWQVAKKSRGSPSARCNLRAKAAHAENNMKPDPRCRRVSTSSSAPPAALTSASATPMHALLSDLRSHAPRASLRCSEVNHQVLRTQLLEPSTGPRHAHSYSSVRPKREAALHPSGGCGVKLSDIAAFDAHAAQCKPCPSTEPLAPAPPPSPATPYLDAARAALAALASSPLTVAATPTQAPSPVETTPPVPVKAPAPAPRAIGCTGSLSGHAAMEDLMRAQAKSTLAPLVQAKSTLAPLVQRSLLESLNLSLSASLLPMAELRPPVPLSLLDVLSPRMPDGGLALLLPFPTPSEIQQWPSSQLAAPDAPLDAPPFSAASAEAEARDEAEVARAAVDAAEAVARPEAEARAAEAETRAAEAEVLAEAERTARAALEEMRMAKEESKRQAASTRKHQPVPQLTISSAEGGDGAISENVRSTMLMLARSMQHLEVLPTRQGSMRPAGPILSALEQTEQAVNNVFTAGEAHRGLTNTTQNHFWPAAWMPPDTTPAGDPEGEADDVVHPDVLLPCKWWKRGTCHYHGSHLSADGKTMYLH